MKKIFIYLFIFISTIIYAQEKPYESPLTSYKDNYFLLGNMEDQVKFQLSLKYNLFYPNSTGIYFAYTQLSHWYVYNDRDTFYTMYQPEIFYRFESGNNIFKNFIIPYVDYIQTSPFSHCSTGVEGNDHRSIGTYYGQIQLSIGEIYNFGINGKYFRYYEVADKNKDINDYKKNYEADLFFKLKSSEVEYLDKEELHFKFGGNPLNKGWYCIEGQIRIITSYIQPRLFIQYWHGYGEFMVNYNQKENNIRVGVIL